VGLSRWGVNVHIFQLQHLRKFCREHDLDEHLIDNTLTYSECKKFLESQVPNFDQETRLDEWEAQEEWYLENHFLLYYISCVLEGSTRSSVVGPKDIGAPAFSLRFMKPLSPFTLSVYARNR
jgi:hypothetical protein